MSEGDVWRTHRRFTLRTLKEFGFGRAGGDAAIREEADLFRCYMTTSLIKDNHMNISNTFNTPVINILWQMVISRRFEYEDPFIVDWMDSTQRVFKGNRFFTFSSPKLAQMMPTLSGLGDRMEAIKKLDEWFQADIDTLGKQLDKSKQDAENYIEAFLKEREKNPNSLGNDKHLRACIIDLFLAGAETTSTTLKWAVLYMTLNEDVQIKCRNEIYDKIGRSKIVSWDEAKEKLPYCMYVHTLSSQQCDTMYSIM